MDSWEKDFNDWEDLVVNQVKNLMIYQLNSLFLIRKLPLYPMFEELDIDSARDPVIPNIQDWYFKDLITLSGLSKVHASKTPQDHCVNFSLLIHYFSSLRNLRGPIFHDH